MVRRTDPRVHLRRVTEEYRSGSPGYWTHPDWEVRFPGTVQGTTGGMPNGEGGALDFACFTDPPVPGALDAWTALRSRFGLAAVAFSRQVHGRTVLTHGRDGGALSGRWDTAEPGLPGAEVESEAVEGDGHASATESLLLGVTVADCVPVFLVAEDGESAGVLHAGWRGIAAGILEAGLSTMRTEFGCSPSDLFLHLGPAICGECYEVGPEVHGALGRPDPGCPTPIDLRGELARRALGLGFDQSRMTESTWCTLCGGSPFFSHRRGDPGRQVGFLGIRPAGLLSGSREGRDS